VPLRLRNAPTRLMKDLGYGKGYRYAHDEEGAYAAGEHYLPDGMRAETWYRPTRHGVEAKIADKLADLRERDRAAKEAVHFIGMPEGNTALAQAAIYLATAPKSNAVYAAYNSAAQDAHHDVAQPVPLHLRNAPTTLMKELEYGKGYRYAHDDADAVAEMTCLPPALEGRTYYEPKERGFEKEIKRRLDGWAEIKKRRKGE